MMKLKLLLENKSPLLQSPGIKKILDNLRSDAGVYVCKELLDVFKKKGVTEFTDTYTDLFDDLTGLYKNTDAKAAKMIEDWVDDFDWDTLDERNKKMDKISGKIKKMQEKVKIDLKKKKKK